MEGLSEMVKHLQSILERATDGHVIGNGSASIVIYASEFYSIERMVGILKGLEQIGK